MIFFSKSGLTCRKISKMTQEYLTNTYLGICDPIKVVWKRFYTILKNRFWVSPASWPLGWVNWRSRSGLRGVSQASKWLYLSEFLINLDETGVKYVQFHYSEQLKTLRIEIRGLFQKLEKMTIFFTFLVIFLSPKLQKILCSRGWLQGAKCRNFFKNLKNR